MRITCISHAYHMHITCIFNCIGEWITGATCMYLVNHFVRYYGKEGHEEITQLMDNLEFVLVPFVNPDGYVVGVVNPE